MIDFKGKTVWITGASSGIGKALAIKLGSLGANLVLSSRKEDQLVEVANLCNTEVTQPQVDILEHIVDILVEKYKIGRPEKIQPTQ